MPGQILMDASVAAVAKWQTRRILAGSTWRQRLMDTKGDWSHLNPAEKAVAVVMDLGVAALSLSVAFKLGGIIAPDIHLPHLPNIRMPWSRPHVPKPPAPVPSQSGKPPVTPTPGEPIKPPVTPTAPGETTHPPTTPTPGGETPPPGGHPPDSGETGNNPPGGPEGPIDPALAELLKEHQVDLGDYKKDPATGLYKGTYWWQVDNYARQLGIRDQLDDKQFELAVDRALVKDEIGGAGASHHDRWDGPKGARHLGKDQNVTLGAYLFEGLVDKLPSQSSTNSANAAAQTIASGDNIFTIQADGDVELANKNHPGVTTMIDTTVTGGPTYQNGVPLDVYLGHINEQLPTPAADAILQAAVHDSQIRELLVSSGEATPSTPAADSMLMMHEGSVKPAIIDQLIRRLLKAAADSDDDDDTDDGGGA